LVWVYEHAFSDPAKNTAYQAALFALSSLGGDAKAIELYVQAL
jgi:hypothetical protein